MTLLATARLAWWLGFRAAHVPPAARRELRAGGVRMVVHEPQRRARGVYVIVPGLHPDGPDDPRMERLSRALAAAGFITVTPFIRDHLELRVTVRAAEDVAAAFDVAEDLAHANGVARPALFAISFGGMPALCFASRDQHRHRIGGLLLFGAYADLHSVVRAIVTPPDDARPWDALNTPAAFLALVPAFGGNGAAAAIGWRAFIARTWGNEVLKPRGAANAIAHEIAATLPIGARQLFLAGCNAIDGAPALVESALAQHPLPQVDITSYCEGVTAPVTIVHDAHDDIVPVTHADRLAAAFGARARCIKLSAFTHGGKFRLCDALRDLRALLALLQCIDVMPRARQRMGGASRRSSA